MSAKPRLTVRDLEVLTAVDHEDQEVYVAVEPSTGRAVGQARLVRDARDPVLVSGALEIEVAL